MPLYAVAFMVFTLANVGLPGTSGFIGEFLTLIGAFQANTWVAFFAAFGIILSAAYALYLYRRVIFGVIEKASLRDDRRPRRRARSRCCCRWAPGHLLRRPSAADHRRERRFDRHVAQGLRACDDGDEDRGALRRPDTLRGRAAHARNGHLSSGSPAARRCLRLARWRSCSTARCGASGPTTSSPRSRSRCSASCSSCSSPRTGRWG